MRAAELVCRGRQWRGGFGTARTAHSAEGPGRRGAIATTGAGNFSGGRAMFEGHRCTPIPANRRPLADRQGLSQDQLQRPSVQLTIVGDGGQR